MLLLACGFFEKETFMRSNRNRLREITSENLLQKLNEMLFVHFFFIDGTGPYTPPEEKLDVSV